MSKKLSKYIAAFDYIDKTLIVLSATSGGISIISFTSVIVTPAAVASASCIFFNYRNNKKKFLKVKKKKKKKNHC